MAADRLDLWDEAARRRVALKALGLGGSESNIYGVDGRHDVVAAVSVGGAYPPEIAGKLRALVERNRTNPRAATPLSLLLDPADRSRVCGFTMRRLPGEPLHDLLLPGELARRGLAWGADERALVCTYICDLFILFESSGIAKVDHNPSNYLIELDSIGLPCGVNSVDPISFAFHHKQKYFGTDVAHPDYIAPELARDLARNTLGRRQIGLHEERFALYALAFHILCGASPIAYSGGRPEPAERAARREFSIHNLPAGAKAPAGVIADWNSLPDALRAVILTGLTAEPANRPSPQKLREELLPIAATPSPSPHHAGSPAQGLGPWPFDGAVALAWARRNRWAFGAAGLLALAASLAATSPGSSTPAPAVAPPRAASATIPRVVIPPPARPPTDPDSLRWLLGTGPQAGPATPRRIVIPPPTRPPTDPDSLRILLGTN